MFRAKNQDLREKVYILCSEAEGTHRENAEDPHPWDNFDERVSKELGVSFWEISHLHDEWRAWYEYMGPETPFCPSTKDELILATAFTAIYQAENAFGAMGVSMKKTELLPFMRAFACEVVRSHD